MTHFLLQNLWMYVHTCQILLSLLLSALKMYVIYQDPFYDDVIKLIDYSLYVMRLKVTI